ncbi:MAG TPA: hypothetical protein VF934_09315, partial [Burkholderiales bacterium]
ETATRLRDGLNQYTIDLPLPRPQAITLENNYNLHQRKTNIQGTKVTKWHEEVRKDNDSNKKTLVCVASIRGQIYIANEHALL